MPELESKQALPRTEIAAYLHEFADELDTSSVAGTVTERGTTGSEARTDSSASTDRATGDAIGASDRNAEAPAETGETTDEPPMAETRTTSPDDRVTLVVGDNSATVNPPESPTFEIEVDSDSSLVGGSEQQSISFELEWTVEEVDDESNIEIK